MNVVGIFRLFFALLMYFLLIAETVEVTWCRSDSVSSQFDPAVMRVPCQEAPAWPPAHQPHLVAAYWRPTAHALALRVGGESRLAGLGTNTFWQALLSHTLLKC